LRDSRFKVYGQGVAIIKNAGFDGETGNAKEYAKWLGSRHRQRV
jgi:hypothetical protein